MVRYYNEETDDFEEAPTVTLRAYEFDVRTKCIAYGRSEKEARRHINLDDSIWRSDDHPTTRDITYAGWRTGHEVIIGRGRRVPRNDTEFLDEGWEDDE